ncbi:PP2C family serine/threonine-protein phosphatase [Paractinoplanes globisporus]|uniref:Protein phosphatase 2C domain-containing protein n=1 Tax=Paractinoplanes globisporus TaxID=113565 RepID=A0ABW6WSY0_9ACTN|nr:PP2C family serine/threonine-protein phosphatase [Actinoplanes globisporus]
MTMTDCASCADERAAGAAFCEACGRALGAPCPNCGIPGGVGEDGYCQNCGMLAGRPRDHIEADCGDIAAAVTDRGRRHHRNEDAMWLAVRDGEVDVVVCDGVSASFDPDVASETAANRAGELLASSPDVSAAISGAKEAVAALVTGGDPRRTASNPACTIVAAAVRGAEINIGWVGDSRAYWLPPDGPAEQLTEDDSWATHAIAMGADPEAAMRDPKAHAITAWLGADAAPVQPRTGAFTVVGAGHLVLCSDGLWNYLTDPAAFGSTIRAHLHAGDTLVDAARSLAEFANAAGGADNITVALIPVSSPVLEETAAAPSPSTVASPDTAAENVVKE